jgi:hypothetical protein
MVTAVTIPNNPFSFGLTVFKQYVFLPPSTRRHPEMTNSLRELQPGDIVRYSVSANKQYGIAKNLRARNGVVKSIDGEAALVVWKGHSHVNVIPVWALALYWRAGMDGRAA